MASRVIQVEVILGLPICRPASVVGRNYGPTGIGACAVDLATLPELSESEIGPLIAGDWLTTVGPFLRDMSSSSSMWWDEVLNVAGALYRVWLNSEPMERLRLVPVAPPAFQRPPWLRIEQRGSVALLMPFLSRYVQSWFRNVRWALSASSSRSSQSTNLVA